MNKENIKEMLKGCLEKINENPYNLDGRVEMRDWIELLQALLED